MTPVELAAIRRRLGLTIAQLAAELRVTPRAVSHYLAGHRKIPGPVERIIECLDAAAPKP